MAEVDAIAIQALRTLGCDIPEDVSSLGEFSEEVLVRAVSMCLRAIDPQLNEIPTRLSASIATKYRQASALANACKSIGYTGDLGYESFLYGGEKDVRKLLLFLLDRLPKEERSAVAVGTLSYESAFYQGISHAINRELHRPWLPMQLDQFSTSSATEYSSKAWTQSSPFRSQHLIVTPHRSISSQKPSAPLITEQIEDPDDVTRFIASVIELNSLSLASSLTGDSDRQKKRMEKLKKCVIGTVPPRPALRPKPALPPRSTKPKISDIQAQGDAVTEENLTAQSAENESVQKQNEPEITEEERMEIVKNRVEEMSGTVKTLAEQVENLQNSVSKAEKAMTEGKEFLQSMEKSTEVKRLVASAAASSSSSRSEKSLSVESIKHEMEELQSQLATMEEEWDETQARMVAETSKLRQEALASENSVEHMKDEVHTTKEHISSLQNELSARDDLLALLRKEYQRQTETGRAGESGRASYTRRILEIVANIKKQQQEMGKIVRDTRGLQKDINTLSGRLERAFLETEERMFRQASRGDEFVKKAYKQVAAFHETCSALILSVESAGVLARESKDLEEQVEAESAKDRESNVDRIRQDLEHVRAENAALMGRK